VRTASWESSFAFASRVQMELRHLGFAQAYLMERRKSPVAREYQGRVCGIESYSSSFMVTAGLVEKVKEIASGEVLQPCVNFSAWAPGVPL
jgi:hypothetical protein